MKFIVNSKNTNIYYYKYFIFFNKPINDIEGFFLII